MQKLMENASPEERAELEKIAQNMKARQGGTTASTVDPHP